MLKQDVEYQGEIGHYYDFNVTGSTFMACLNNSWFGSSVII